MSIKCHRRDCCGIFMCNIKKDRNNSILIEGNLAEIIVSHEKYLINLLKNGCNCFVFFI